MLDGLNTRTRKIVHSLLLGEAVSVGGTSVAPLDDRERVSLFLLVKNVSELSPLKGAALAETFLELHSKYCAAIHNGGLTLEKTLGLPLTSASTQETAKRNKWRLSQLRAESFRGLAPAGVPWEFNFKGDTHLFHGPNGCGKSSLLGAICWCLTGRLFRDDCEPLSPQPVEVYRMAGSNPQKTERFDALALLDGKGNNTQPGAPYYVDLQLTSGEDVVWIRRHSLDGLQSSTDGAKWQTVNSIEEIGLAELDAELHILMPARVPHLKFGKNADLVKIFAQIVGLDDLENLAEVAKSLCTNLRSTATRLSKHELTPKKEQLENTLQTIIESAPEELKSWPEYNNVLRPSRDLQCIEALGTRLHAHCVQLRKTLAKDLGIQIPSEESEKCREFQQSLKNLPGQVQSAIEFLARIPATVLPLTFGEIDPSKDDECKLNVDLSAFEREALTEVAARLAWTREELADPKVNLMLQAAEHFRPDINECPVCDQNLEFVPRVTTRLLSFKEKSCEPHLRKTLEDHERELLDRLNAIIPVEKRTLGNQSLSDRIAEDWKKVKQERMPGLLEGIAGKFDTRIAGIAANCEVNELVEGFVFPGKDQDRLQTAYNRLEEQITHARRFLKLLASLKEREAEVQEVHKLIAGTEMADSLLSVLERGRETNAAVSVYEQVYSSLNNVCTTQKSVEVISDRIATCGSLADCLEASKRLADLVRKEVVGQVRSIEPSMQRYYKHLYNSDILPFNMLTAGHAMNPDIKDLLNAYLKAGNELVPIAPFANAGRLRALALCFIFALLDKSPQSLAILVLDDPALSMDDQHKARFLTHLLVPRAAEEQVLLATHYENFFNEAKSRLTDVVVKRLTPRRCNCDAVGFEPGKWLDRVEESLKRPSSTWMESAIGCRKWLEETLGTLSAYSPVPFHVYNNIRGTIENYRQIQDPRIKSTNRDHLLRLLSIDFVKKIHDLTAHAGSSPINTDIEDLLKVLRECEKYAKADIEAFKENYYRDLQALSIEARPVVQPLKLQSSVSRPHMDIVGMAAASGTGTGIQWQERSRVNLGDFGVAVAKLDVIAPIAHVGQVLLLDGLERLPENEDLVIARTREGERFLRRFWRRGDFSLCLEATNPIQPYEPIFLRKGFCEVKRMVGVIFDSCRCGLGKPGDEWFDPDGAVTPNLKELYGLRVYGSSMEPVARDGQMVLVRESSDLHSVRDGELVCVDLENHGAVVKRCFSYDGHWYFISVNHSEVSPPIVVAEKDIRERKLYVLRGVLFEYDR